MNALWNIPIACKNAGTAAIAAAVVAPGGEKEDKKMDSLIVNACK